MKTIAFVMPWFGFDIPGGAEMELKGLVSHLHESGVPTEILTTCVKSFNDDWSENYYKQKKYVENGISIRRFKVRKRNGNAFGEINTKLLAEEESLTADDERIFCEEMINSPDLYKYIRNNKDKYSLFVFIPYMFGTTYYGVQECLDQAVMIPCFHDENYIYMERFKETFSKVAGMIFHAQPEADLASRVYNLNNVNAQVLGEGVYTGYEYNAERFRKKYNIDEPFILYAGRKDEGKNIYTLIAYFDEYKKRNSNDLKLILIGGGDVYIPDSVKDSVIDLGYVDMQDKYDACAAASLLCQPSKCESFSLVIMESWLCETPVLVHEECNVTKYFASESNGGLYFRSYFEFDGAVNYILNHPEDSRTMGQNGRRFVLERFSWDVIVDKYMKYFQEVIDRRK